MLSILVMPLSAQVGRYELKRVPLKHWYINLIDTDRTWSYLYSITVIFDSQTGEIYHFYERNVVFIDKDTIKSTRRFIREKLHFTTETDWGDTLVVTIDEYNKGIKP